MKTKISRFFHSKKLVRVACVLCAMLPLWALGLFAFSQSSRSCVKISASAAPAYVDVYGVAFLWTLDPVPSSFTIPAGVYYGYSPLYVEISAIFYSDTALTHPYTSASPVITPIVNYRTEASNSAPTYTNGLTFYFEKNPSFSYSTRSGYLTDPIPVGSFVNSSYTNFINVPPPASDYPVDGPTFDGKIVSSYLDSFVVATSRASYIYPTRPSCYLPVGALSFLEIFYSHASLYSLSNGDSGSSYDEGYQVGYSEGYNKGQTEQLVNPLSYFIAPVQTFLDTKLFGVVSIGTVLNVALFVSIALIFIKMFAGG